MSPTALPYCSSPIDAFELRGRIRDLRFARGVLLPDLARAIDMKPSELDAMLMEPMRLTRDVVERIAVALAAPRGWPDEVPDHLPRARLPISAKFTPEEWRQAMGSPVVEQSFKEMQVAFRALKAGDLSAADEAHDRAGQWLAPSEAEWKEHMMQADESFEEERAKRKRSSCATRSSEGIWRRLRHWLS